MTGIQFDLLNPNSDSDICKYERALYRAFVTNGSEIHEEVWDVDHRARRLRAGLPYGDQEIFVGRFHGEIVSGAAINRNMAKPLRLERYGFSIDKSEPNICEGFALFNLNLNPADRSVALNHQTFVLKELKRRGIVKSYGTCEERRRRGYALLGFEFLDELKFHGATMHLMVRKL